MCMQAKLAEIQRRNKRNACITILVLGRNAYISYYISTDAMQQAKLAEIQRRNKRNARMAVRTTERGPARFVLHLLY
jgi:hypothetical protein